MTIIRKLSARDIECLCIGEAVKVAYQKILRMTELAVLIKFEWSDEWIPKSQIAYIGDGEIWLGKWFAKDRFHMYYE